MLSHLTEGAFRVHQLRGQLPPQESQGALDSLRAALTSASPEASARTAESMNDRLITSLGEAIANKALCASGFQSTSGHEVISSFLC